jgi:tripartite ATP-independent transporter DctP family solute receptor
MRTTNLLGTTVFALLGLVAAALPGEAREIKFGHVGEPSSLFEASVNEFARRANERLPEGWKVVAFGSSQLGGDKEMLQKLKLGTVDLALPSTVMSTEVPEFGLFEMPYLVKDREHMKRIADAIFWPVLAPAAEAKGYRIIGLWENGFRHVTNNVRPTEAPDDLKGIKLRVPQGAWRVKMFQAYGANPTPLAFSEVFVALQTGVIDGEENPLAQIASAKFQEVQKYLSLTGHVYTPAYVTAGRSWGQFPPEVQKTLKDAAAETQAYVYETAARMDKDLLEQLKAGGMQVNEPDKQAFIKASAPVYEEFGKEVPDGKRLVENAQSLAGGS